MALKKITVIHGILSFAIGLFCILFAVVALSAIDIKLWVGNDTGILITIIEGLKGNVILSILVLFVGYSHILSAKNVLFGKKAVLDLNIDYKVIAIETDDAKSTVKIDLKDTATGDTVTVRKETKHLDYFKNYIEKYGNIMPGTFAKHI